MRYVFFLLGAATAMIVVLTIIVFTDERDRRLEAVAACDKLNAIPVVTVGGGYTCVWEAK